MINRKYWNWFRPFWISINKNQTKWVWTKATPAGWIRSFTAIMRWQAAVNRTMVKERLAKRGRFSIQKLILVLSCPRPQQRITTRTAWFRLSWNSWKMNRSHATIRPHYWTLSIPSRRPRHRRRVQIHRRRASMRAHHPSNNRNQQLPFNQSYCRTQCCSHSVHHEIRAQFSKTSWAIPDTTCFKSGKSHSIVNFLTQ